MSDILTEIEAGFKTAEQDAAAVASGILKLFGNEPAIDVTPVASASTSVATATTNLQTALSDAASAGTAVLEGLADGFINGGVAAVPVLNTLSGVIDPIADADANTALASLKALIASKIDALFAPKAATPATVAIA